MLQKILALISWKNNIFYFDFRPLKFIWIKFLFRVKHWVCVHMYALDSLVYSSFAQSQMCSLGNNEDSTLGQHRLCRWKHMLCLPTGQWLSEELRFSMALVFFLSPKLPLQLIARLQSCKRILFLCLFHYCIINLPQIPFNSLSSFSCGHFIKFKTLGLWMLNAFLNSVV